MFSRFKGRLAHYPLLVLVWGLVTLPGLGRASLWDIDEGNNSEAAQEMYVSGSWIVPTFNYKLREDKPALLYWLQAAAFRAVGVNELGARLPSALAGLLAVLLTYELGRFMFGAGAGFLAGLILGSGIWFCAAARFANPDALLNLFCLAAMAFFWWDYPGRRCRWMYLSSVACALAVLAKGPVGLVLPTAVLVLFLLWERQLGRLLSPHYLAGGFVFLLVAVPWYVWVALETKGAWLRAFWLKHNQGRFLSPMESHSGPFFYYVVVLVIGLAPWSIFLISLVRDTWGEVRRRRDTLPEDRPGGDASAVRFLLCWFGVYFLFFTVARTKLPNYILPLFPAVAILMGRFLDRWRSGVIALPARAHWLGALGMASVSVIVVGALLLVGGVIPLKALEGRTFPGLAVWSIYLGAIPLLAAAVLWRCLKAGQVERALGVVAVTGVLFTGSVALLAATAVEPYKATRALARSLPADHLRQEIRLAAFEYFQPSLVFYCQREVRRIQQPQEAVEMLYSPLPVYVFMPRATWERLRPHAPPGSAVLAERYDLYDHCDVVMVTNRPPLEEAEGSAPGARFQVPGVQNGS